MIPKKALPDYMTVCHKCHKPYVCLRKEKGACEFNMEQNQCICNDPCKAGCPTRVLTQSEYEEFFNCAKRKGRLIGGVPIQ